ncbi:hypothetical protein POVCU2_0075900 [Plasmodium ovale curtisi]|uniref:Uncharacterized protein n=1 Tax=Plasmodium ovale curtisi TaxID=864141 RepID=A0A1A8WKP0_PLAOA|nr:hypothetical protein POVCU2_0075900 [Plasmodium ovale curtisi]SBT02303.1 hypothetical protein POVCU1_075320 [Plasmodium ovale curtisi]
MSITMPINIATIISPFLPSLISTHFPFFMHLTSNAAVRFSLDFDGCIDILEKRNHPFTTGGLEAVGFLPILSFT